MGNEGTKDQHFMTAYSLDADGVDWSTPTRLVSHPTLTRPHSLNCFIPHTKSSMVSLTLSPPLSRQSVQRSSRALRIVSLA
eukprot:8325143-Pyramimonas_sp.AAC.1